MCRLDRVKHIYQCSLASAYEDVSAREAPRAVHGFGIGPGGGGA